MGSMGSAFVASRLHVHNHDANTRGYVPFEIDQSYLQKIIV